jgi:hypothetical protein
MTLSCEYKFGQIVYLITDPEQLERMITAVQFQDKTVMYQLRQGAAETWHFEIEISETQDQNKLLNIRD